MPSYSANNNGIYVGIESQTHAVHIKCVRNLFPFDSQLSRSPGMSDSHLCLHHSWKLNREGFKTGSRHPRLLCDYFERQIDARILLTCSKFHRHESEALRLKGGKLEPPRTFRDFLETPSRMSFAICRQQTQPSDIHGYWRNYFYWYASATYSVITTATATTL